MLEIYNTHLSSIARVLMYYMASFVFIQKEHIKKTLEKKPTQGKRLLEPLKSLALKHGLPFNILEDSEISNNPEIHMREADLWNCLDGEVEFICGGEIVDAQFQKNADGVENKNEITGKEIRSGKRVTLHPGDWLYIPAGKVHQHNCSKTARLMIIKIP